MKFLKIELIFFLFLTLASCGSGSGGGTPATGGGNGTQVGGTNAQEEGKENLLYKCYGVWGEFKSTILQNKSVPVEDAEQVALGFTASKCLAQDDLEVLKRAYEVYKKADVNTNWKEAEAYVKL
jgi:hypothetical protein